MARKHISDLQVVQATTFCKHQGVLNMKESGHKRKLREYCESKRHSLPQAYQSKSERLAR